MTHEITEKHKKMYADLMKTGDDAISVLCDTLSNESAPVELRKDAARTLKDYYHPKLDGMGALIEEFGK